MSIDPGQNKKVTKIEPLKLSVDSREESVKTWEVPDDSSIDTEAFLREAFHKDEWLGCTLLFDHYYAPMCSHAVRFVYSKEYAEDVVADVFSEFWQKKQFTKVTTSFRTYLFRAVRNRSMNMLRREIKQIMPISDNLTMTSITMQPDDQMIYDQFYLNIQRCIDRLPPKCRKVFLMSRFENKPLGEIAKLLGVSVRTVEAHINKALSALRVALKNENY